MGATISKKKKEETVLILTVIRKSKSLLWYRELVGNIMFAIKYIDAETGKENRRYWRAIHFRGNVSSGIQVFPNQHSPFLLLKKDCKILGKCKVTI